MEDYKEDLHSQFIINTLWKRRKYIIKSIFIALSLSTLFAFTRTKVWQGEFQIVLSNENSTLKSLKNLPVNSPLSLISNNSNNSINTEVEILKSPSILIEIFEYVKSQKIENKNYQKTRFNDWSQNLDINLEKGTSVLNIAYRDDDKKLIIPVLNKISNKYQNYSEIKRFKSMSKTLNYLDDQRKIYRKKSLESLNLAQEYAIEQDISVINQNIKENKKINDKSNKDIINYIDIEKIRIDSSQQIRLIDELLVYIEKNEGDIDKLSFVLFNNNLESLIGTPPNRDEILKLDKEISFKRTIYKPLDKSLIKLKQKRDSLVEKSLAQTIGLLNSKRDFANIRINSSKRPKGVLLKYRQLLASAKEDLAIKNRLEKEYRITELEKARSKEAWDLITKPTLLPNKVSPKRLKIITFGLSVGFFLGILLSLYNENKKNLIYKFDNFENLIDWKLIDKLKIINPDEWQEIIQLISKGIIKEDYKNCYLLKIGDIDEIKMNKIYSDFSKFNNGFKFNKIFSLGELTEKDYVLPIIQVEKTTKSELMEIYNRTKMLKIIVKGFILIE